MLVHLEKTQDCIQIYMYRFPEGFPAWFFGLTFVVCLFLGNSTMLWKNILLQLLITILVAVILKGLLLEGAVQE